MKILIAYDGSQCANEAIQDMKFAGLPKDVDATVLTVADVHGSRDYGISLEPGLPIADLEYQNAQDAATLAREVAEHDAETGVSEVEKRFPNWNVTSCVRFGSPAATILEIAGSWKPDLIVMGSHGRGALGRIFLGSVSIRVAGEARTSVRITRHALRPEHGNIRTILLAFDGSPGSRLAIHNLLKRSWPLGTRLHIVSVIDLRILASPEYTWMAGSDAGMYRDMNESHVENVLRDLGHEMKKHFTTVTISTPTGAPLHEILEESKRVKADVIFLGSHGLTRLERLFLGSVAHGVAAHAEATIEIAND